MIQDELEGRWERFGGKTPSKWGKLTRTERNEIAGRRHSPHAKLEEFPGLREEGDPPAGKLRPWRP